MQVTKGRDQRIRKTKEAIRKERQYNRQNDWAKENTKIYNFKLSKNQDAEIIAFLDSKPNKAGYLKDLVKKDMLGK